MKEINDEVFAFFRGKLNISVASPDTDLIQQGHLDSLGIVELLFFLEQRFNLQIDLASLEMDQLSSVGAICRLIAADRNIDRGKRGV